MNTLHFWYNDDDSISTSVANDRQFIANLFDNSGGLPFLMVPVDGEYRTCLEMIDSGYEISEIRSMAISATAMLLGSEIESA